MRHLPHQFNTLDKELWIGKDLFYNTAYMIGMLGQDPVGSPCYSVNRTIIQNTVFIKPNIIHKIYLISALKSLS